MTKWPVRDGSPFDDGGEAFQKACVEELMSESRDLTDAVGLTYAYECACGYAVPCDEADTHASLCDKLAEFVRGAA
jgi:hypothetical protein